MTSSASMRDAPVMRVRLAVAGVRIELDVPLVHVIAGTLGAAAIVAAANLHHRRALAPPEEPPARTEHDA